MRYLYTLLLFFLLQKTFAQQQYNLVPNWSFEDSVICSAYSNFTGVPVPNPWYFTTNFECRKIGGFYCNRCNTSQWSSVPYNYDSSIYPSSSYQETKTGDGYAHLPTYKEWLYLQTSLKHKLAAGKKYWCNYWVSTINISKYATNNLGILFTNTPIYPDTTRATYYCNGLLAANPQITNYGNPIINDTLNWVPISGIYTATGGEHFITLGNFKPDSLTQAIVVNNTIYAIDAGNYYIDDVSVIPLDSMLLKADAGRDTTITLGDSAFIGSYTNGIDSLKWQFQTTGVKIDSTRPGFWVKPTVSTCYVLTQTVNGFTSSDTVCINVGVVPLKFTMYDVRFTIEKTIENFWTTNNEINVSHFNIQRSINGRDFINVGKVVANNKNYNEYHFTDDKLPLLTTDQLTIYYRLQSVDKDGRKQYTEIKTINYKPQTTNGFSLHPNPTKDFINISSKESIKEVRFINQLGQVVKQLKVKSEKLRVDVSDLPKGLYVLNITTIKGEVKNEKLIIE